MQIRFGQRDIRFPSAQLGELRESQHLPGDASALRARLQTQGYLLLRGLLPRAAVLQARQTVLQHLQTHQALLPATPLLEGVMPRGGRTVQMMGRRGIAHHPAVLAVLEHPSLFALFAELFDQPALTFPYKWLRAVGNEQYTGAHYDFVYMGQGSRRLHTVWIPFGDIPPAQGTLAVCAGSHSLQSFAKLRASYGRMDVDRDGIEGWFSRDPMEIVEQFGGQWLTANYRAGDVILFGMHTMHASTTNSSHRFRLSCDVRYQPISDPVDARWRKGGSGHYNPKQRDIKTARTEWGI